MVNFRKKLWKITSEYIRKRDRGVCFTCGRYCEGQNYHAGHYIPSSICGINLRYDERNIHGQCYNCNINLGGFGAMYERKLLEVSGKEKVDELWEIKKQNGKWYQKDYQNKIEYYQNKLREL